MGASGGIHGDMQTRADELGGGGGADVGQPAGHTRVYGVGLVCRLLAATDVWNSVDKSNLPHRNWQELGSIKIL